MKGIIFNLVEEIVRDEYGEDTWDDLLESAGLEGAYSSLGSYPDGDLDKIVGAASDALHMPAEEVVQWVGLKAIPYMAAAYPQLFASHTTTRSFVLSLNDIIHPEVRKLYPGADVPVFGFETFDDDLLVVQYRSHRKMCAFAIGLIEGAAAYYGECCDLQHTKCMHRGDENCEFRIRFARREA